jgi:hypothetical protein
VDAGGGGGVFVGGFGSIVGEGSTVEVACGVDDGPGSSVDVGTGGGVAVGRVVGSSVAVGGGVGWAGIVAVGRIGVG